MDAKEILDILFEYTEKKRAEVYNEADNCRRHNYHLEANALSYKSDAYTEIRQMLFELSKECEMEG